MDALFVNPGLDYEARKILKCLQPKDVASCRLVSQKWRHFIDNDKTWWSLQIDFMRKNTTLFKENLYDRFFGKVSTTERFELIEELFPGWKKTFDHLLKVKTFKEIHIFCNFMWTYFKNDEKFSSSPLHLAVSQNKTDIVKSLLTVDTDFNERTKPMKMVPLHFVKSLEMFELFVEHSNDKKIDLNAVDSYGRHFFHFAIQSENGNYQYIHPFNCAKKTRIWH